MKTGNALFAWLALVVVGCGSGGGGGGGTDAAAGTGGSGNGGSGGSSATGGSGGSSATGGSGGSSATGGSGGSSAAGGAGGGGTGGSAVGGSAGAGGGPVAPGTVQGVITRTASLSMPQDGKGTLYVDVGPQCPYTTGFAGAQTATIPNADMNDPNVQIPWQITGIAPGTYAVWGWLDDNGDTIPATPFPSGDPANSACVTVTLTATAGATADLQFNAIL